MAQKKSPNKAKEPAEVKAEEPVEEVETPADDPGNPLGIDWAAEQAKLAKK